MKTTPRHFLSTASGSLGVFAVAPDAITCAALALNSGVNMAQLDIRQLQNQLRKDGVYLEDLPQN